MGQYFNWVNVDKHEQLDGFLWNYPPTLHGRCVAPCEENQALLSLLATRWKGDVVVFYGDYAHFDKADHPGCVHIRAQIDASGWNETDFPHEARDVTGFLKVAKDSPNNRRNASDDESLEYYDGPFSIDIKDWRYVVNPSRWEYIDYQRTPVIFASRHLIQRYDPLPLLLASATWALDDPDEEIEGRWLGDVVFPTDENPGEEFTRIADGYVDNLIKHPVLPGVTDDEVLRMMAEAGIDSEEEGNDDILGVLVAMLE